MNSLNIDSCDLARRMRLQALQMVHRANASHIGSALSICDIVAVLYGQIMRLEPENPTAPQRDRFVLSKGHACVAIYAALAETGFFPRKQLMEYGKDHSVLMNHISHKVAGVEFSTGSLGHGLPFATGKALAAKRQKNHWRTFVVLGDGELAEGSNWEAMMFAAHHQLDNLVAIVDYNKLQSLTTVDKTLRVEPLADKARAFGWAAQEVDGHNHAALKTLLSNPFWEPGKPSFLIAHTTKGKGVSFMEDSVAWHYKSPSADQLAQALEELNHA
ncbi:transketolase [Ideonella dechloratans]|uniref:transketolase n=1 Tax=Ideonella dechloratans TaxID=36863 RepID=UPI0035B0716E